MLNFFIAAAIAVPLLAPALYERVPISQLQHVRLGAAIEVVGYFSHLTQEIDGDLQIYLIDHHGQFVVVEAPHRFRPMKSFMRSLHLHRDEVVIARGLLTRQSDKPTKFYLDGWPEIQPVEAIARYSGALPDDLHYTRVVHRMFGRAHISQI